MVSGLFAACQTDWHNINRTVALDMVLSASQADHMYRPTIETDNDCPTDELRAFRQNAAEHCGKSQIFGLARLVTGQTSWLVIDWLPLQDITSSAAISISASD